MERKVMKTNDKKTEYEFTILRPGGNDQMLIQGLVPKNKKRLINDEMIKRFPNVEQVSFYAFDRKNNFATLELAGGEFCGNATRSLAYLLLNGNKGKIKIKVSGTKRVLNAGINQKNTAFAQMPISNLKSFTKLKSNLFRVDLEGITQLVFVQTRQINPSNLKRYALKLLQQENLIYSVPAAGVMFITDWGEYIELKPIVWVRDIETLLYETACASGTAAVGIWKATQSKATSTQVKILQPSLKIITAEIYKDSDDLVDVYIDGDIEILEKGSVGL
ncbi:MAG: Uncharacterized protein G01um10147_751 [Microgenomates group bacterium Gr01-1014_7]|nr:MAG: Uncharacterized protein G01um10147_751 [Microgenomates group bacterium Gr01-1014_7]